MIQNHIKEAGLAAVHCAMDALAPTAHKHLAEKAECHGKEFPFIYRHYEVTDIPNHHAEGGYSIVSYFVFTVLSGLPSLICVHSAVRVRFCL